MLIIIIKNAINKDCCNIFNNKIDLQYIKEKILQSNKKYINIQLSCAFLIQ